MQVGDLVAFDKRHGIIVEDCTMIFDLSDGEPYTGGAMMVLVGDQIERIVYANLRLANESR